MTTAQKMNVYQGFAANLTEKKSGSLKERIIRYFRENAMVFAAIGASMNGSSYAYYRYVLPGLSE